MEEGGGAGKAREKAGQGTRTGRGRGVEENGQGVIVTQVCSGPFAPS